MGIGRQRIGYAEECWKYLRSKHKERNSRRGMRLLRKLDRAIRGLGDEWKTRSRMIVVMRSRIMTLGRRKASSEEGER